jgi:hypothetical protein
MPRSTRPNYRHWFTSAHLNPPSAGALAKDAAQPPSPLFSSYYKPNVLSQLEKTYAYEMTSTLKFTR